MLSKVDLHSTDQVYIPLLHCIFPMCRLGSPSVVLGQGDRREIYLTAKVPPLHN